MWAEKGKQPIRPNGQGQGIMVSDFIEEHGGYLRLSNEEYEAAKDLQARLLFPPIDSAIVI